ncbi:ATP/GTP-binding protein [Bacteroides sp. 224]|uniref:AAA family ATPase n=1 Tax=Bacteroides sp. 224 TaxID=2302936 RepID=UPI0013D35D91|nr:AAA family ATPase [Bacteroides sp. 224]NDV65463.1 ATP-binding protein [Bacteroides sp. 224]
MIQKAMIHNFMGFSSFENPIPFPKITVIVGKNDTCKTGLLKLLYATGKANELFISKEQHNKNINYKRILSEKFYNVFQPRKSGLGDLVKKESNDKLTTSIFFENNVSVDFSFGETTKTEIQNIQYNIPLSNNKNYLFIPAKEVLTAFNAIKAISNIHHYPGFDETYMDLINSLDVPTSKDQLAENLEDAKQILIKLFDGELMQVDSTDRFIFKKSNTEFSMQLTAEGIKRIGILTTLLKNKQLTENTVLFMDEPETCLHPGAIREMINLLSVLTKSGIQLFLTTHNYFVLKQLYIIAQREKQDILCCSLEKEEEDIKSSFYNLKEIFPQNSIVEETLKMYDEEIKLNLGLQ